MENVNGAGCILRGSYLIDVEYYLLRGAGSMQRIQMELLGSASIVHESAYFGNF